MIGADLDAARRVHTDIVALGPWDALEGDLPRLCSEVAEIIKDPDFPGAVAPAFADDGSMQIYIAAPSVSVWRRLKPVLMAFAGPTLTAFDGIPEPLTSRDPLTTCLIEAQPAVTAIMRLHSDDRLRNMALRAILRARDTLARAPDLQRSAPVPTSRLLAHFQDMLNVGRRDAALGVLDRLRSELRLDSLNLKFLEVQLFATFGEWSAIVGHPEFPGLCRARRTPAITAYLLKALYRTHLDQAYESGDEATIRAIYERDVRPHAKPMTLIPAPRSLPVDGWRIYALEAIVEPDRDDLAAALADRRDELGWLADLLAKPSADQSTALEVVAPLDAAREALVRVEETDSSDLLADAMALLARLDPDQLASLRNSVPFRAALRAADAVVDGPPPKSWPAWLGRVFDPNFVNAIEIARSGKDEWEIGPLIADPAAVGTLESAFDAVQEDALACERTMQALPYLVAWLQRDQQFPRAALSPIYGSLLTLFAMSSARGHDTYESSQVLIGALLSNGLDPKSYRNLVADIKEIAGDGFGVGMIYWVLEVVEMLMNAASPDDGVRRSFMQHILVHITPIYARLTPLQRLTVKLLSSENGWPLPTAADTQTVRSDTTLFDRLSGQRIAIYSLTEASSRQAKAALEQICPTVVVDLNADHGGTPRLRALAERADLFVMTWLSAKHAATDFIREWRGKRPLLYAQGKGFSSILRVIEDHYG